MYELASSFSQFSFRGTLHKLRIRSDFLVTFDHRSVNGTSRSSCPTDGRGWLRVGRHQPTPPNGTIACCAASLRDKLGVSVLEGLLDLGYSRLRLSQLSEESLWSKKYGKPDVRSPLQYFCHALTARTKVEATRPGLLLVEPVVKLMESSFVPFFLCTS